jgi:hypothetical protein
MADSTVHIQIAPLVDLSIDSEGQLVIIHDPSSSDPTVIWLGVATTNYFADLISYVHRLSINAVDA